jgi:hypothetical protein
VKLRLTMFSLTAALVGALILPGLLLPPQTADAAAPAAEKTIKKELKGADLKDKAGKTVGKFDGEVRITDVKAKKGSNELLISGVVEGTAKQNGQEKKVSEKFTDVAASILPGQRCDILTLDIPDEGLVLNLLGLVIDVGPVEIDIYAISGGGLLGDLLCGLVNLLNPND